MRILIAGASGFIGTELTRQLQADGHTVTTLVRSAPRHSNEYLWMPSELTVDPRAIDGADAVINLAGVSTGRIPWTTKYKRQILYSRVNGTQTIAEAIARSATPPAVFLNGSAVGYYGDQPGAVLTETSQKGEGFLSDVVEAWEHAARLTPAPTRVVVFRTGLVVGKGGAFTPLIPLTMAGLAASFGSGEQNWPWISLYDEAAAIRHLLVSSLDGVVNLAGPTPATSREITDGLADAMHRWHKFTVPEFAVNALGDAGNDLLLSSENVSPQRLLDDGFQFRHETAEAALRELVQSL
ncbi:TIGR01777 family oxidoreductase [Salinibacterium sp. G-O1]|uniref:TIGR01777 family oxidoreductase n=1 Tax=Salinibacterium sp. G-O1 TaxID=3046208 RepID=UPI0024BBBB4E|nr:TIGR01777 family oxidoreductase [Salinibacterium sp. G-O1]MDJ0334793.1 TIGR01777 family oxidoreductase [Salinibacterium sp. G-O1]